MSVSEIVDSGIPLPRMAIVQPFPDYTLRVKWAEGARAGRVDLVDVGPAVFGYRIFRPLRDERLFLSGVIAEDGDAVSWGTDDLMMSADTIQSLAQESWSPVEFTDFLTRMKLTQEAAAALLGRSRRQIATYATRGPIPRIVTLACYGFESLRRDRFVSPSISQPPTVHTGPASERGGPVGSSTESARQR